MNWHYPGFGARAMVGLVALSAIAACSDDASVTAPETLPLASSRVSSPPAPAPLVTVTLNGRSLNLWPYAGTDFSGTPHDPINLIFAGESDPRMLRAALRALDGNRTAFGLPNAAPFNCTWSDAIGNIQVAYAEKREWVGSAMQLECGQYGPIRFHLRFFRQGDWTIANAHFELLIPGTADHEVLSWELAEKLVTIDMIRTGLLGALPSQTGQINAAPTFRTIRAAIYNGLPVTLRGAIGGPLADVTAPVGINTDGSATIFNVARSVPIVADSDNEEFILNYNQLIPKPFCAAPTDFLFAQGPLSLKQTAGINANGKYSTHFTAKGELTVTPFDPVNRVPIGAPYQASIFERHESIIIDGANDAYSYKLQREIPDTGPFRGTFMERIRAHSREQDSYVSETSC